MANTENNHSVSHTCPYLGFTQDEETAMAYPSGDNICHHIKPARTPSESHQEKFCLSPLHIGCEVYKQNDLRYHNKYAGTFRSRKKKRKLKVKPLLSFLLLLAAAAIIYQLVISGELSRIVTSLSSPQADTTWSPVDTAAIEKAFSTPTLLPGVPTATRPVPTRTPVPPTITPTYPGPSFVYTPMGMYDMFVIHRVREGESVEFYANRYKTTIDAIMKLNKNIQGVLRVDQYVVIPRNTTDVQNIPPMEAFVVEVDGLSVQSLAEFKGVDLALICEWNGLPKDYIFEYNEVVLLPQP